MFDLSTRRLYLCVGLRDDLGAFLPAVLRGGVDIVQLREKVVPTEGQLDACLLYTSHRHGVASLK